MLVVPWFDVTNVSATFGLTRLLSRGPRPLPNLAIDAALLYLPVGVATLLVHRAEISFHFETIIILLTTVHYHYVGFALPLVTGLAGHIIAHDGGQFGSDITGRVAATTTLVMIVNIVLIANHVLARHRGNHCRVLHGRGCSVRAPHPSSRCSGGLTRA